MRVEGSPTELLQCPAEEGSSGQAEFQHQGSQLQASEPSRSGCLTPQHLPGSHTRNQSPHGRKTLEDFRRSSPRHSQELLLIDKM